ncbi:MAG: single-stranded-DNA-specific exonuclease RecJ [Defluviitaleaceae bacterium]|nr:single-stranded-DNA-specific exonuclease RecJ [Defluviitaleaceae bacterium]
MNTSLEYIKTETNIALMAKTLGISENLAILLANRGIKTKNEALKYLKPVSHNFFNGSIKGFEEAKELLENSKNKKICIYGDYDVDGVMSIAILKKMLKKMSEKYDVCHYVPHRVYEGYGLNEGAIRKLHEKGCELLIVVDNGISAVEEIKFAKSLNLEVIVIDHHEPSSELPPADVIINPKQLGCSYPFKEMCAAGLCYRFAMFLGCDEKKEEEFLIYAAIATLCDVVDLIEDNRVIVKSGLAAIKNLENKGLLALLKRVVKTDEISEEAIGYYLGPCLNAAGRLDSAEMAISLILEEDENKANELAELNETRKELLKEAGDFLIEDDADFIILHKQDLHESLAGILAGRISDKYNKPTLVLTGIDPLKGSGRSVDGFNLYKALAENRDLFARFGGHEMAAGLTMPLANLQALRNNLDLIPYNYDKQKKILIDAEIPLSEVTYTRALELNFLRPFGRKNEAPIFLTKNIEISELRVMEEKNTLIFTFIQGAACGANVPKACENERVIKGICFGKIDEFKQKIEARFEPYHAEKIKSGILRTVQLFADVAYHIEVNSFRGNKSVQMRILDVTII